MVRQRARDEADLETPLESAPQDDDRRKNGSKGSCSFAAPLVMISVFGVVLMFVYVPAPPPASPHNSVAQLVVERPSPTAPSVEAAKLDAEADEVVGEEVLDDHALEDEGLVEAEMDKQETEDEGSVEAEVDQRAEEAEGEFEVDMDTRETEDDKLVDEADGSGDSGADGSGGREADTKADGFDPAFGGAQRDRIADLAAEVAGLQVSVREAGKQLSPGSFMETDPVASQLVKQLQNVTRALLEARYGKEPYRVALALTFPKVMVGDSHAELVLEMAPLRLMPHAVHVFFEGILENFQGGYFHRKAPHVLQVQTQGSKPGLTFQEYSAEFPHKQRTLGFAGRPGGPHWYISTLNNSENHGPGTQQWGKLESQRDPYEADSCFGQVVQGWEDIVLKRISQMSGSHDSNGFIDDRSNWIKIESATLIRDPA